ncbi:MAG: peptide/nickel transport system permease protein [Phormidesmis priestleyi Ana]|uniref:Peptide/nickel transport system permease protein n=1 Tax=Phormidesmis priestleyi Ana TaxID=1666911 RepID=A0A0P8DCJ7_9CYAN|nr:MAG: peptide/nickel transport system permease protein [Phormidesmis priestleyi Ana]
MTLTPSPVPSDPSSADPSPADSLSADLRIDSDQAAQQSAWSQARYVISENGVTFGAFLLFFMFVLFALFGSAIAPYDPLASNAAQSLSPPTAAHWFGTDDLGRDVLSRVIVATRLDLGIATIAVIISFFLGSILGTCAGYFGGIADKLISRLVDTIMAFPLFILAMGLVAALGNTVENIIYATAVINLPLYTRVVRSEVLIRRDAGYIEAARLVGNGPLRIMATHLFPNVLPVMMVHISLNMGWAILNAAGLSFIGLGVRPPTPEWGIMVAEGATYIISGEWWLAIFPGIVLMLAVFCFNLLGDGLRDLIDPRMRT